MLESNQQSRSSAQLDPATHLECLEFIRAAMDEADREFAQQIAAILKDVCQRGHADRAAIWRDLTATERQQFQTLLAPSVIARDASPQNPRGARLQFPRRDLRHRERVERGVRHGLFLQQLMFMRLLAKPNLSGSSGLPNEPGVRLL